IIAYKQPISRTEIESIRGVSSDYSVQKLLEKELVEITGRAEGPGRPLLYGTTLKFLNHFGLKHAKDLPKLKELATTEDTIGVIDTKEEE
ncbi:MAG: SMC-Scp complex subunit ScpB, partial [Bacteroidota bacterium]